MDTEGKKGSFTGIFVVMFISLLIFFFWDSVDFIKNSAHWILNPSAGVLLTWNVTLGMIIIILIISIIMTLIQKSNRRHFKKK